MASVGTAAAAPTTLFSQANAGDTTLHVNSTSGFTVGDPVAVGSEKTTVTAVGTQARTTTLAAAASGGDTNVKLANVTGLAVGDTLNVDTGGTPQAVTISNVGTAATSTTLSSASVTNAAEPVPTYTGANWMWNQPPTGTVATGTILVRRDFTLTPAQLAVVSGAAVRVSVDDQHTTYFNGTQISASTVSNGCSSPSSRRTSPACSRSTTSWRSPRTTCPAKAASPRRSRSTSRPPPGCRRSSSRASPTGRG